MRPSWVGPEASVMKVNVRLLARLRVSLVGAIAAGSLSLVTKDAQAQQIAGGNGQGIDTHLFRPAMDSKGFFTTNGSEILGHNDISFGLVIDYGNTLLRVNGVGQKSPQLINHSFQGTAQFNYGLFNQVVLGLDIPVNLMTGDEQTATLGGVPTATEPTTQWNSTQLDSQTLGFLALHAKWRITRIESAPIGVAIGAQL